MKLLALSIVFFATTLVLSFATKNQISPVPIQKTSQAEDLPRYTPRPTISPVAQPDLTATSVYILDVAKNEPLYAKNADLLIPPASTTKMLTALVAFHKFPLSGVITIPALTVEGQKMRLFRGEQLSTESLLYGLLVFSANDAAETFALAYPGGRDAFIEAMNIEARNLGLQASVFKNPTGLDDASHVSTAREMAMLGGAVMREGKLRQIVGTTRATVTSVNGKSIHYLANTNELLSSVPGVLGIKTGWTEESRENLVTYIERDNHAVIISLFGSDDRFGETKKLIDWVYTNAVWN